TFLAAFRGADAGMVGMRQVRPIAVLLAESDGHAAQPIHAEQPIQRVLQHGSPADLEVLLGALGAHASADAGGRNDAPESAISRQAISPSSVLRGRRQRLRAWF